MEILITWEGGAENFFTGLKPELGNGYADYIMTPNMIYTVQLRSGSDIASGLTIPTCQTPRGNILRGNKTHLSTAVIPIGRPSSAELASDY